MALMVQVRYFGLTMAFGGRVLPWLGPALRGTVAGRLKDAVCRWPPVTRAAEFKTCRGCVHHQQCDYGVTFESAPPPERAVPRGMADGHRAIVLAPTLSDDSQAWAGDRLLVQMILIGPQAVRAGDAVAGVLCGVSGQRVLGPDGMAFEAVEIDAPGGWPGGEIGLEASDLPASPRSCPGRIPLLAVELTAPLFLKDESSPGRKGRAVSCPTLAQLLRASLRVMGRSFACFDQSLDGRVEFAALKESATAVRTEAEGWTPFCQSRASRRSGQRFELHGVLGGAVYRDVPLSLLPWLVWGGRLGVGDHRVAGAGRWRVVVY